MDWKPISEAPTSAPIVGGWMRRGEFRYGLCVWGDRYGWASDRGAVPTHYLVSIPIGTPEHAGAAAAAAEPFEPDPEGDDDEPDDEPAKPDPEITDWDGDPTGPPVIQPPADHA